MGVENLQKRYGLLAAYVGPTLLGVFVFSIIPILYNIFMSFTNRNQFRFMPCPEGLMYDRTFVYANSTRRADAFPPYLFILPGNSECRQMSSYCDADTTDSLRQDISKGIDLLVKEVQRDLFYPSAALPNGGDAIRDDASGN